MTGLLAVKSGASFEVTIVASIVIPTILAALISIPVLRLSTHYFALATLGIGQILLLLAVNWSSFTGGALGLSGVPLPTLFGYEVKRGVGLLVFVWGFVIAAGLVATQVRRSAYGIACHLVRESPLAARAMESIRMRFAFGCS